ncbi:MAG: hypothetical protein AAF958_12335 [Planctomycetota bacterium]
MSPPKNRLPPHPIAVESSDAMAATIWRPAYGVAQRLARHLGAPLVDNPFRDDLVRVHKARTHPRLFCKAAKPYREFLLREVYDPYHERLSQVLRQTLGQSPFVVHLSVECFSPATRGGERRRGDVGLVHDPQNQDQVDLAMDWVEQMYDSAWMLKVRRNYPRSGTVDSIVHAMRKRLCDDRYIGLVVMMNRHLAAHQDRGLVDEAIYRMAESLREILGETVSAAA